MNKRGVREAHKVDVKVYRNKKQEKKRNEKEEYVNEIQVCILNILILTL